MQLLFSIVVVQSYTRFEDEDVKQILVGLLARCEGDYNFRAKETTRNPQVPPNCSSFVEGL